MFKRILVSTDASEYSRRALSAAIEIAKKFHSEIEIFYVASQPQDRLHDYMISEYCPLSEKQVAEIGNRVLEATLERIDVSNVTINKKISTGHPVNAILDEIRRDFDLVVMGSRGHSPIGGALIGSVTQRVLADASCPVLVVK